MTSDVFISYSSDDDAVARSLKQSLEDSGLSCWFAPHDLHPSQNYQRSLVEAIDSCHVVLLVLSRGANASAEVLAEIAHADLRERQIVVVSVDVAQPSDALRPMLIGCERVDGADGAKVVAAVRRAERRSAVAHHSKLAALVLSVAPGMGLWFVGVHRWGGVLVACGVMTLLWSNFLELGTPLDNFLSCVFHVLVFVSIVSTAHVVLGSVTGSMKRKQRWLPYVASLLAPGSGIAYAGRRGCAWAFFWILSTLFAVVECSGMSLAVDGCCLDAALYLSVCLLAIAESGFEDAQGRHRNPWLYSFVVLFVLVLVCSSIPRCGWNGQDNLKGESSCST